MARLSVEKAMGRNILAFLDMIAFSEIGPDLLADSDDGYNVCVGSLPGHPILMPDYSAHPRLRNAALNSDAAGRYQLMGRYWDTYKRLLNLPDFGPESQDLVGIQLIRECHSVSLIQEGQFAAAVRMCRSRWASLPGAGYGQHENDADSLQVAYVTAGGTLA